MSYTSYVIPRQRPRVLRNYGTSFTIPDQSFSGKELIRYSQSTSDLSSLKSSDYLEGVENPQLKLRPFYDDELDFREDLARQKGALEKTIGQIQAQAAAQAAAQTTEPSTTAPLPGAPTE